MEIWQVLAGWEKLSIIVFSISLAVFLPSIKFRSLAAPKIVLCVLAITFVSWLAPILGFGLAARGFTGTAYAVFLAVVIIPQLIAWRKNESRRNT